MNNDFEPIRRRKSFEGKSLGDQFSSMVKESKQEATPRKPSAVKSIGIVKGSKGCVRRLAR